MMDNVSLRRARDAMGEEGNNDGDDDDDEYGGSTEDETDDEKGNKLKSIMLVRLSNFALKS